MNRCKYLHHKLRLVLRSSCYFGGVTMVSKILVIGNRTEFIFDLKNKLTRNKLYSVKLVESLDMAVTSLTSQAYHIVIMDMDMITEDKIQLASNLKRLGYGFPVLLIGKTISKNCFGKIEKIPRLVLLEKPFEDKDFFGITNKLISGREVKQKQYRRFYTNQTAHIELFGSHAPVAAKMLNLSKGGAYFEVLSDNIDVGKIVKLNVDLSEVDKQYQVNARVIWASPPNKANSPAQSIGVEFLHATDVYRNLLNNL